MTAPVVVGVDDMDQSPHALYLAGREAEMRAAPLWIVHSYHRAPPAAVGVPGGLMPERTVLDAAVEPLAGALKQVRADHPGTEIRTYALSGSPAAGLASVAEGASLLVLGNRGRGGFAGMLLGSVALRTVARAHCPVAVARGTRRESNRVLAGVDVEDEVGTRALLGFAFDEAVMRAADLVVLHTWEDQGAFYPDPTGDYTRDHLAGLAGDHRRRLDAMLRPWRRTHADVAVEMLVEGGSAARSLVAASGHADLLVIGARRRWGGDGGGGRYGSGDGSGGGMRLGALAYSVLHHARCPVVVVPER